MTKYHKMLKKEINDTKRWRDVPCSWVGRNNIVKIIILPKAIHRFNAILIKLPLPFFTKLDLKISQFVWKHKRPQRAKSWDRKTNWRNLPSCLQTILGSFSHQDNTVLPQKQKYRLMEKNRLPRDKPMHLWAPYLWQRRWDYTVEKRQSLQ